MGVTSSTLESWIHKGVKTDILDTVECAGTTLAPKTKPITVYYLCLRGCFALYAVFLLCWSFYRFAFMQDAFFNFFTYMTQWGLMVNTTYFVSVLILHTKVYLRLRASGALSKLEISLFSVPSIEELGLVKLYYFTMYFCNVGLPMAIFIITLFWALVYEGGSVGPITWNTHGMIGSLVLIEWLTSTWRLSYWGALTSFLTALGWVLFSLVFYLAGWTNEQDGGRYIYAVIDWGNNPGSSAAYSGVVCLIVPLIHCGLVKINELLLGCWLRKKGVGYRSYPGMDGMDEDKHELLLGDVAMKVDVADDDDDDGGMDVDINNTKDDDDENSVL